ncbi:hypothetical protein [Rhodalgimonas zhirmunskyi]|uniref:Dihydroorotate dehydrogenase n=1 Tax=Rhodalgimonas zhirmunskyi TaxID=2964767 RepID=A0AAJ1UA10_9RHOB|nr:hypothetical protein [Rhodoalgimonas zhirmunskyi]MDQ2095699.1 hypothetical protein [Rhodoalgimonas zhirmunskyi]
MAHRDNETDRTLEAFFSAARETRAEPSAEFMARMMSDALAAQAGIKAEDSAEDRTVRSASTSKFGLRLGGLFAALGGWPAMTGLTTAALTGIWLGFSPVTGVSDTLASLVIGESDSSYVIDYGAEYTIALYDGESE